MTPHANLTDAARVRLQQRLSHNFNDVGLLTLALTHKSYATPHNERLEFLGDAVLGQVVAAQLFAQFPEQSEAGLTLMRAHLVRKETLAQAAQDIQLGDALLLGAAERSSGAHRRASLLSNALEAIVGGVFLDGGYAAARTLVLQLLQFAFTTVDPDSVKDAKTRLQELLQGQGRPLPRYELQRTSGAAHAQEFFVACVVGGQVDTTGNGSSRRSAEQMAAQAMLHSLEAQ